MLFKLTISLLLLCASVVSDIVDNCDYDEAYSACGDVCVFQTRGCYCGIQSGGEEIHTSGPNYCCVDTYPTGCFILSSNYWGSCPEGRVLSKTETCNGFCFNDFNASKVLGPDSRLNCGDQCVPSKNICQGYSLCKEYTDVGSCNSELKCVVNLGFSVKSNLVTDLTDNHYFCDYQNNHNDGEFSTITREDETNLDILTKKANIDYGSISECTILTYTEPGLMCGKLCFGLLDWCTENFIESCSNGTSGVAFSTNNPELCANTTFWRDKVCEVFYVDGSKYALGERCSGGIQHCTFPWYLSSNEYYEVKHAYKNVNLLCVIHYFIYIICSTTKLPIPSPAQITLTESSI